MDSINRPPSQPDGADRRAAGTTPAKSATGVARKNHRTVTHTKPLPRYSLHPVVLKLELRQRLGDRTISRLRDILRQGRISLPARKGEDEEFDDHVLCVQAEELTKSFDDTGPDQSQQEIEEQLRRLLENKTPAERRALEQLLQVLMGESFAQDDADLFSTSFLPSLRKHYSPRAVSIFFATEFGRYVLEQIEHNRTLTTAEEKKMALGLTHIASRLDVRANNLPDAPVIEYANLFMGQDIDLEQIDQLEPLVVKTLEQTRSRSKRELSHDKKILEQLTNALASPVIRKRLPLTLATYKQLKATDPAARLYRSLMNHQGLSEYLEDNQLSLKNLEDAKKELERTIPKRQRSVTVLDSVVDQCAVLPEAEEKKLNKLRQLLDKAIPQAPSVIEKQALSLLRDHLQFQLLDGVRKAFEKELYKQLQFLEEGGSEKEFTASVNIGGALAAAGVSGLSIDGELKYSFKVTGGDDIRIRELKTVTPTLTLTGGDKKVATLAVQTGYQHTKGRAFSSLDKFVRFHSNDLVPALLGSLGKAPANIIGSINVRKAEQLQREITADRHLLTNRLIQLGVILPGDTIKVEQQSAVNYADFSKHSVSVKETVNALAGVVELSATQRRSTTRFRTKTDLLAMLRNNPDRSSPPKNSYLSFWTPASSEQTEHYHQLQDQLLKEPSSAVTEQLNPFKEENGLVSVRVSGDLAVQQLKQLEQRIQALELTEAAPELSDKERAALAKERLVIRDALKKAIVDQFLERDMYYFTVNAMEGHVGEEAPQEHFHQAKHSMQDVYGVGDRGEYIAAHIYSFYHLHQLYERTFLSPETPLLQDSAFQQVLEHHIEPSLTTPQVHLDSQRHVFKSLTAPSVASSTETNFETQLALKIPQTDLSVSADLKFSRIGKNVNPDNDGSYCNIGLNIGGGGTAALAVKALEAALTKMRAKDSTIPELYLADLAPEVLGLSAEGGMRLEFNFVKRGKGWKLQYTRVSGNEGIGISSPNIGIPTGPVGEVKIGGSAKVSSIHNWWERPGNNTLTYMYAKFNGWKAAQMVKTPSWQLPPKEKPDQGLKAKNPFYYYALRHKTAISEMLVNMGKKDKSIHRELTEMLTQLDKNSPLYQDNFAETFTAQLKDYSDDPKPDKFQPLLKQFERFLTLQHEVYLKEARSRYRPHYRKGRII